MFKNPDLCWIKPGPFYPVNFDQALLEDENCNILCIGRRREDMIEYFSCRVPRRHSMENPIAEVGLHRGILEECDKKNKLSANPKT